MGESDCGNFQYHTEPQTEATDVVISTMSGSEIEIGSSFNIRSANSAVKEAAVVNRLGSISGISEVKFGWKEFQLPDGGTTVDTARAHSGTLKIQVQKGSRESVETAVSEVFDQIHNLVFEHEQHTRNVERITERFAVSQFESER